MKILSAVFLFILFCNSSAAQSTYRISGVFGQISQKEILLKGFGFQKDSVLARVKTDAKGKFVLHYPASYIGAALLEIKDLKSVIVLLNKENFEMQWTNLEEFKTLSFTNSPENDAFSKGMQVYQESEAKQSGLSYLLPLYSSDASKSVFIAQELKVQQQAMTTFFTSLPVDSYAAYYLKMRKLIADMPQTASRYFERMPEHESQFNSLDFADQRLLHSGLYTELLQAYVILMESYGDQVFVHTNASTDAVLKSLKNKPDLQQEVSVYLFNFFEKRSLFKSAEHLALAMLDPSSCQLESKPQALFEQYRKMAIGNSAPGLQLENAKNTTYSQLSDLKNKYRLVVFASSWCSKCQEEIPKLASFYPQWKNQDDLEIVLVSLDTEKEKYEAFNKDRPWISSCDFKGWEGQAARDYCVFATPTMYLLDADGKIVLKPISPEQINAWLEMVRKG